MAEAEDRNKVGISIQALLFNIVCAGLNDPQPHFFEYPDVFFFGGASGPNKNQNSCI